MTGAGAVTGGAPSAVNVASLVIVAPSSSGLFSGIRTPSSTLRDEPAVSPTVPGGLGGGSGMMNFDRQLAGRRIER